MLWRIRPIEVRVKLFTPPRGKAWPACYFVEADDEIIGELSKHPDTRTSKHPWKVEVWNTGKNKALGVLDCLQHAVEALLKAKGMEHCPFAVTFDAGSVNGRPFDFGRADSLGDDEDRVHFTVLKDPKDGQFYVDCVIVSRTIGCNIDLEVRGPFASYREAGEAGREIALEWLPPRGVRVDDEEVEGMRRDIRTAARTRK